MLHFDFGQLPAPFQAAQALNVVREQYRELLALGPTRPMCRSLAGCLQYGPDIANAIKNRFGPYPSQGQSYTPGQKRLDQVVGAFAEHVLKVCLVRNQTEELIAYPT